MPKARLKKTIARRIANGHPFIYENEINRITGSPRKGEIIDVFTFSDQFIGRGYYNPDSKIVIRLLTRQFERIDADFIKEKLHRAVDYRKPFFGPGEPKRLFNSTADGVSGIKIDDLGELCVISSTTAGADRLIPYFVEGLKELGFKKILEKSIQSTRRLEGIEPVVKEWEGTIPKAFAVEINGLKYHLESFADKTPLFNLENRVNARETARFLRANFSNKPIRVLDAFCGNGRFGLNILKETEAAVGFLDRDPAEIEQAQTNCRINGFDGQRFISANAFDYLRRLDEERERYDCIILDPPTLSDSRRKKGKALTAYKEINLRALKVLREGGILASACCSHTISAEEFEMMFYSIASDLNLYLTIVKKGGQTPDFPIIANIFETDFLKFYIIRKGTAI